MWLGMIPTFASPGEMTPGQFGPTIVGSRALRPGEGDELEGVVERDAFRDHDDEPEARLDRLDDGVLGVGRGDEED